MQYLKFIRDLLRDIVMYGSIIALVITAIVFMVASNIDRSLFFALCFIVSYCWTGITKVLFRCVEQLKLGRRTKILLLISASIAGTIGGVSLAQAIIARLFKGVVLFRGMSDLPRYIIFGFIAWGFVTFFEYLNTTRKEKHKLLEQEKERTAGLEIMNRDATIQMLRSRLNPHFLFNTLNTISELIHQDPIKAEKAVMNLSDIYRKTLVMSEVETVPVSHEIELMEKYLENERMRFDERLEYHVAVDPSCASIKIPALILQPFVENAITKGISPKKDGGSVSIEVRPEDGGLLFSIRDTGVGCETFRTGFGIQNVLRRMTLLYQDRYRFEFKSEKGKGATVALFIPGER
jgi:two-component system, LytTR family, sensor kinase